MAGLRPTVVLVAGSPVGRRSGRCESGTGGEICQLRGYAGPSRERAFGGRAHVGRLRPRVWAVAKKNADENDGQEGAC